MSTMANIRYYPAVRPSAIAIGTIFTHTASFGILAPLFGDIYRRAQAANTKEEFFKSKEATSAASAWSSSLAGSALQSYGVGALVHLTNTMTYSGAACLGSIIFFASTAPSVISQVFVEKRPLDTVAVGALTRAIDTVGLSLIMNWWGTRPDILD